MKRAFYAGVFGALSGVALCTLHPLSITFALVPMLASVAFFMGGALARRPVLHVPAIFLIALAIGVARTASVPTAIPDPFVPLINTHADLQGTVVTMPDIRETSNRLTVEVRSGNEVTRIIAVAPLYPAYHVGDLVEVTGTPKYPEPFDGDAGHVFAYDKFLAKDGVFAVVQPAKVSIIGRKHSIGLDMLRALEFIKGRFMDALGMAIPEPESALAVGILVGGKQGLGAQLLDAFTVAGMLQIVVLSGYNVMIVAEGVLAVLGFLPKRVAFGIASLIIPFFVLLAGSGSSAVRAGVMALIALFARATHRTYDVMRTLFMALVVMVLWNPLLLVYDPGLQLSFMATLGLILGAVPVAAKLTMIRNEAVRGEVATGIAAQLAVLPIILYQSGNLSIVSLPANLAAMPVIPFAMATSAVAGILALVFAPLSSFLPTLAGLPAYVPLAYVIHVAAVSASLPFAEFIIPAFPFWVVVVSYAFLGMLVWRFQNRTE